MRQFAIKLSQNLGTGRLGASLDVTHARVDIGAWKWEADKELTKISHGDITVRLADIDGAIWAWIKTQTQIGADLLPPWLTIDIDGVRGFTGICQPSQMSVDRDGEIAITAQGWSSQLDEKVLGALRPEDDLVAGANPWLRPSPVVAANRPASSTYAGVASQFTTLGSPVLLDTVYFPEPCNWVQVGDLIDANTPTTAIVGVKVLEVRRNTGSEDGGIAGACAVRLSSQIWPVPTGSTPFSHFEGTFTRRLEDQAVQDFYQVVGLGEESPCHRLLLDTVDGQVPGDQLKLLNSSKAQSWTVLQTNAEGRYVVTREEVKDVAIGDRVFFTDESRSQLVFEDARAVISRAAAPFRVDFSRFTMPSLPVPVLVWLPLRPLVGADLTSLRDLEAGLGSLRAFGSSWAWDGTPEAGWSKVAAPTPRAPWTSQLLAAPGSLMPDESASKAPKATRRNRVQDLRYRTLVTEQTIDPSWDPETAESAPAFMVHDYLAMRRILVKAGGSCEIQGWSGSAWGTTTTYQWLGLNIKTACVFPGITGALLIFNGNTLQLATAFPGPVTASCAVPVGASDAVLLTTPWGAYLVGSKGYGRVSYSGGALSLAWVQPVDQGLGSLFPTTFAGLDPESVVLLARFDSKDKADPSKVTTETWLLRLEAEPNPADAPGAVLWSEKVLEGAPILCGALRDPSQADRVVGHCGGRLFQIGKQLPQAYALERFKASGMKAAELIEYVAQVLCAIVAPSPDGVLHLVSRHDSTPPIDLAIPACETMETRAWEHRYSLIRVAGEADDLYRDVPGPEEPATKGGQVLEFTGHPMMWTLSGCEAMARVYHAWFSPVRLAQTRTWMHTDPNTAAPWESLPPVARVRINGEPKVWRVLSLDDKRTEGEAKVKLLEVF